MNMYLTHIQRDFIIKAKEETISEMEKTILTNILKRGCYNTRTKEQELLQLHSIYYSLKNFGKIENKTSHLKLVNKIIEKHNLYADIVKSSKQNCVEVIYRSKPIAPFISYVALYKYNIVQEIYAKR